MNNLNDTCILNYGKWVQAANTKAKEFLEKNVQKNDVVVTHHAPSWKSRDSKYGRITPTDYAYYNELDEMICKNKPKLWIHGHTHEFTDYQLFDTRVVSAPHGYAHYGSAMMDKHRVIEV